MLHRSVTLIRRSECARPNESSSSPDWGAPDTSVVPSWISWVNEVLLTSSDKVDRGAKAWLFQREHPFDRDQGTTENVRREFDTGRERIQRIAQLLERVQTHVGTLAAIAVLVSNEVELLARRQLFERITHTALGHNDELISRLGGTPIDDSRS